MSAVAPSGHRTEGHRARYYFSQDCIHHITSKHISVLLQAQILRCSAEQQVHIISQKILPGRANVIRQAAKTMRAVDVCFFFPLTPEYEVVPLLFYRGSSFVYFLSKTGCEVVEGDNNK